MKRNSLFVPIKLFISKEENLKRIKEPSRREKWKSIDPQDVHQRKQLITITHPNLLELDVSQISAKEAAKIILEHMQKLK